VTILREGCARCGGARPRGIIALLARNELLAALACRERLMVARFEEGVGIIVLARVGEVVELHTTQEQRSGGVVKTSSDPR
jgi:hypothetical protein